MQKIRLKKEPRLDPKLSAFVYQADAVRSIRDLEYAAIFHEQGLGKTKIAIDLLLYWLETKVVDTVLLIVKKGLLRNWVRELDIHSYIRPRLLTQDHQANHYVLNSPARLILTHYEAVNSERNRLKLFLKTRDVAAILDESTKIKNPDSALTKAFFEIAPLLKRRIIMTGTPVANRPYDIWSQIWFLDQGKSLGDNFREFKPMLNLTNELASHADQQDRFERELELIYKHISSFCVRETKMSGVITLPEKTIETVVTDWEPRQWELYRQIRDEMRAVVIQEGMPAEDKSDELLKRLLRLVQVASNPKLVDGSYSVDPGKLPYLLDIVARIHNQGEKCIVWTSFTENADSLAKALQSFKACRVHGKLTMEERDNAIIKFMTDDQIGVLVATPGAAKEGLTLTVANHVIFYDRSFSLDDYLQAQDRIHRVSQTKPCFVYNLIMQDSIDEWVDLLLRVKELAAQLAQGDISAEYYRSQVSYEFGEMIKQILNISQKRGG
jgi:SNF2 family DNA or RNA helicase